MAESIDAWHAEHVNFARLLELLETEVSACHLGEALNYDLMRDIVEYLRSFADRVHHPREDVAFTRLAAREPELQLVVNRLLQEHRVIALAGDELMNLLNEAAADIVTPRAALEAAAATYLVYYRHHVATEEREMLPRAAQLLTRDDWAAIAATVPAAPDPLFDNLQSRFAELRRQIGADARGYGTGVARR